MGSLAVINWESITTGQIALGTLLLATLTAIIKGIFVMLKMVSENNSAHGDVMVHIRQLMLSHEEVSAEAKLQIDTSKDGRFECDADGNCTWVNAAWMEATGMTMAEARGDGWMRSLHEEDRIRVSSEWTNAAHQDVAFGPIEFRYRRPDGSVVAVVGTAQPLRDAERVIIGWKGKIVTVSPDSLPMLVEAVQRNGVILSQVMATYSLPLIESSAQGECIALNDAAAELLGMTQEEALGQGWAKAVDPADVPRLWANLEKHTREGTVWHDTFAYRSGTRVRSTAQPIKSESGQVMSWITSLQIIPEQEYPLHAAGARES